MAGTKQGGRGVGDGGGGLKPDQELQGAKCEGSSFLFFPPFLFFLSFSLFCPW